MLIQPKLSPALRSLALSNCVLTLNAATWAYDHNHEPSLPGAEYTLAWDRAPNERVCEESPDSAIGCYGYGLRSARQASLSIVHQRFGQRTQIVCLSLIHI